MTELKYLKDIAKSLDGIYKELKKMNREPMTVDNPYGVKTVLLARENKDETNRDMETGKSDDV